MERNDKSLNENDIKKWEIRVRQAWNFERNQLEFIAFIIFFYRLRNIALFKTSIYWNETNNGNTNKRSIVLRKYFSHGRRVVLVKNISDISFH